MEPVTLIVTALAAGAAAAPQDGVKETVKDGYQRLRDAVSKHLEGRPAGQMALERHEASPWMWEKPLAAELSLAGAGNDFELVESAQALLRMVDHAGTWSGKYNVTVRGGQGVQIGDRTTTANIFKNH